MFVHRNYKSRVSVWHCNYLSESINNDFVTGANLHFLAGKNIDVRPAYVMTCTIICSLRHLKSSYSSTWHCFTFQNISIEDYL